MQSFEPGRQQVTRVMRPGKNKSLRIQVINNCHSEVAASSVAPHIRCPHLQNQKEIYKYLTTRTVYK